MVAPHEPPLALEASSRGGFVLQPDFRKTAAFSFFSKFGVQFDENKKKPVAFLVVTELLLCTSSCVEGASRFLLMAQRAPHAQQRAGLVRHGHSTYSLRATDAAPKYDDIERRTFPQRQVQVQTVFFRVVASTSATEQKNARVRTMLRSVVPVIDLS